MDSRAQFKKRVLSYIREAVLSKKANKDMGDRSERGRTEQECRLLRRKERWHELIAEVAENEHRVHLSEEKIQAVIDGAEDVIASVGLLGPVDDWAVEDMILVFKPTLTDIVHDGGECDCNKRGRLYTSGRRLDTNNEHAA